VSRCQREKLVLATDFHLVREYSVQGDASVTEPERRTGDIPTALVTGPTQSRSEQSQQDAT